MMYGICMNYWSIDILIEITHFQNWELLNEKKFIQKLVFYNHVLLRKYYLKEISLHWLYFLSLQGKCFDSIMRTGISTVYKLNIISTQTNKWNQLTKQLEIFNLVFFPQQNNPFLVYKCSMSSSLYIECENSFGGAWR